MGNEIDWNKPIQTRDGRPARYLTTLTHPRAGYANHPVIVVVFSKGSEHVYYQTKKGFVSSHSCESPMDIINVPEEYWVNVYRTITSGTWLGSIYSSEEIALREKDHCSYVKTIKIEL